MKKFIAVPMALNLYEIAEAPNGQYVLAKDVEKLEQLNKEMLLDFGYVLSYVQANYPSNFTLIDMIRNAIKKAEEI